MQAAVAWLPLAIALSLHEPKGVRLASEGHRENLRTVLRALFASGRFTMWLTLTNVVYAMLTIVAVFSFQAQWTVRGVALGHFGWLWAAQNLVVALAARAAHRVEDRLGFGFVIAESPPFVGFGMGWLRAFAIAVGVCFPLCRAQPVVLRTHNAAYQPSCATANSLLPSACAPWCTRRPFSRALDVSGACLQHRGAVALMPPHPLRSTGQPGAANASNPRFSAQGRIVATTGRSRITRRATRSTSRETA